MSEWISVSEGLPEVGTHCLVWAMGEDTDDYLLWLAWFRRDSWEVDDSDYTELEVTHWMPLPPGPE